MKSGAERAAEFARTFDHEGALLRHDDGGLSDNDDDEQRQNDDDDESTHGALHLDFFHVVYYASRLRDADFAWKWQPALADTGVSERRICAFITA